DARQNCRPRRDWSPSGSSRPVLVPLLPDPPAHLVSLRPGAARAAPAAQGLLSFNTTQRLFFEIGRLSSMNTRSPTLNVSSSSWAWNFLERRTVFLNSGCV